MYDYVTRKYPLDPEEQEMAEALIRLTKESISRMTQGEYDKVKEGALADFKRGFFSGAQKRLGFSCLYPDCSISDDCKSLVVLTVEKISDDELEEG